MGDNVCSIGDKVVRVVAFQAAGGIGDVDDFVKSAVSRLRSTGAHVGIYTETMVLTADRHNRIITASKNRGFLVLSHNAAPRAADDISDPPEDQAFGPRASGC